MFDRIFKIPEFPDIWLFQEKRTLLWVARKMRWHKRLGGKTPEEQVIARLEEIKKIDPTWGEAEEESLYGSAAEEAMFQITLRQRQKQAETKYEHLHNI